MNTVGPRVRQIRELQKLTQEQFVARCNVQGWDISRATLAKIESQVRRVTDSEVLFLANCLKVDVGELFKEVVPTN
jgi:transcriptional regulator with XRE-family HTH domain